MTKTLGPPHSLPIAANYAVDKMGKVWSKKSGNWRQLHPEIQGIGYEAVNLSQKGVVRHVLVHKLVAEAFLPPQPTRKHEIRHLNGNPADNRVSNLAWGTRSDNNLDSVRHGTHPWARKTYCPQGHPYSGANLILTKSRTNRRCRTCKNERMRAARRAA